jgi:Domain of unknown function (DUF4262)
MQDRFRWPKPESEADEIILRNVRKHGCHIVGILGDKGRPQYAFSVGLYLIYGHAELVIFGLDGRDAAGVINDVCDHAAKGKKFVAGDVCDDLLLEHKVCFVEVPAQAYRPYFGTALWFYGTARLSFPILQIVWPDRKGRFPWETGYDATLKKYQPVLRPFS